MPAATYAPTPTASPLRWAGGKRWLIPTIVQLLGETPISAYHEPFLGGASVFLGLPQFERAYLSDVNPELIETFEVIRDQPAALAAAAAAHANDAATYYRVRDLAPTLKLERAARFLYLNHTSFNGIYRVNLNGEYNVPFGNRSSPNVPGRDHLAAVAQRLTTATLRPGDFATCLENVGANDLVFLDPPYTVAHNHNGFIKYNQRLFSFEDQKRLSALIDDVKGRGAYYVLANAAHDSIKELFEKGDRRFETTRRNSIGGINAARGSATEYLFTNLPVVA